MILLIVLKLVRIAYSTISWVFLKSKNLCDFYFPYENTSISRISMHFEQTPHGDIIQKYRFQKEPKLIIIRIRNFKFEEVIIFRKMLENFLLDILLYS